MGHVIGNLRAVGTRVAAWWDEVAELDHRLAVLGRPWEHDALHWSPEPDGWALHGSVLATRGRGPVTPGGWCPCARRA